MTDEYKVGDLPPEGYLARNSWAMVQLIGGLREVQCNGCYKWLFPQEVAGHKCTKGASDDG